ncbi:MAG: GNAT family N-acetyltransferase [Muribaculaceae bacterium]|nr:GNAT family N-acetyltransferase [Muribaculaceae bacterium]
MSTHSYGLRIEEIFENIGRLMPLLLIGDESEAMINRYLSRGRVFAGIVDNTEISVCVVTSEPGGYIEIKNLAVAPHMRRQGIGRAMLAHIESLYRDNDIYLGTGETPSTLRFYMSCGYSYSHRIENFFTDNYDSPIIEEGVRLKDMIYLKKSHLD